MSETAKVHAEVRNSFGKGFARRLRSAGKIPAVIYGHGTDPVHVALPGHQVSLIIRRANALLDVEIDGGSHLTLVKDVQRDPVLQIIEHIDLVVIKKGEKVIVEIPLVVTGEPFPGNIVTVETATIKVEAEATHIPQSIEISVEGLLDGVHITAGEVELPKGSSLIDDADLLLVAVVAPAAEATVSEEEEAEAAE